jgi:type IV pilus assembly protein PilA
MKRNEQGFTLMELMVVIVIVAILAAVAVPLYINYVKDAQRTEAKGAIGAVITAEQVFYQKGGGVTYTDQLADLNVDLSEVSHKWAITIPAADAHSFQIKARQIVGDTLTVIYDYDRTSGTSTWTP